MDQAPQGLQLDPDMVARTVMTWPAASRGGLSGSRAEIDGIAVLAAASLPRHMAGLQGGTARPAISAAKVLHPARIELVTFSVLG